MFPPTDYYPLTPSTLKRKLQFFLGKQTNKQTKKEITITTTTQT